MKWLKLKSIHCSVPINSESHDRLYLTVNEKEDIFIGKITYDQTIDLSKKKAIPLEKETTIALWDSGLLMKRKLLGEYKARIKKDYDPDGEINFNRKGDYSIRYKVIIKGGKKFFQLTQIICNRTVASLGQDKVYFLFNGKPYQSKFILKQNKMYGMQKYPPVAFEKELEMALYTSELLRADQLIGKKKFRFSWQSLGEKEIVFDRDTCLYQLKVEIMQLQLV